MLNKPFPRRKNRGNGPVDLTRFFKGDAPARLDSPPLSWRAWHLIHGEGKFLGSLTADYTWEGPVATTRRLPSGDLAKPQWANQVKLDGVYDAGIYSYKTPHLLIQHLGLHYPVYGRLENMRGVEHEFGYRSRLVTIQELWVNSPEPQLIHELSTRYACDVFSFDSFSLVQWLEDQQRRYVECTK